MLGGSKVIHNLWLYTFSADTIVSFDRFIFVVYIFCFFFVSSAVSMQIAEQYNSTSGPPSIFHNFLKMYNQVKNYINQFNYWDNQILNFIEGT